MELVFVIDTMLDGLRKNRRFPFTLEHALFLLVIIGQLTLIWSIDYFATQDGPSHVYNAYVFRNLVDSVDGFRQFYELNLKLVPNWLTTLLLASLMQLMTPFNAEKVLMSFYVIGMPFSIRYALNSSGKRTPWLSYLSFPIIYNDFFYRGFYNYLLSIPVFIVAVGYWLRHRDQMDLKSIFCLSTCLIVLYFCHIVGLVSFVVTLTSLVLSSFIVMEAQRDHGTDRWHAFVYRLWLATARPLIALIPPILLTVVFAARGAPPSYADYSWKFFFWWCYGVFASTNTVPSLLLSVSITALWTVILYHIIAKQPLKRRLFSNGLLGSALALFTLYFVGPEAMSGGNILNPRWIPFVLILLVLWFETTTLSYSATTRVAMVSVLFTIMQLGINGPVYSQVSRDASAFLSSTASIKPGHTVLCLCVSDEGCGVGDRPGRLRISPYGHLCGYVATERRLISLSNTHAHTTYYPIRYKPVVDPIVYVSSERTESGTRIWGQSLNQYRQHSGKEIEYILVWGMDDANRRGEQTMPLQFWLHNNYEEIVRAGQDPRLLIYRKI